MKDIKKPEYISPEIEEMGNLFEEFVKAADIFIKTVKEQEKK